MITPKSLNTGWTTLECSVKDCPKRPEIALQVFRKAPWGYRTDEEIIPATREYIEKGLLHFIVIFTPCPSDEEAVREYLIKDRGYTPDMITVIPKGTIERYSREEAEREYRRAGRERQ